MHYVTSPLLYNVLLYYALPLHHIMSLYTTFTVLDTTFTLHYSTLLPHLYYTSLYLTSPLHYYRQLYLYTIIHHFTTPLLYNVLLYHALPLHIITSQNYTFALQHITLLYLTITVLYITITVILFGFNQFPSKSSFTRIVPLTKPIETSII